MMAKMAVFTAGTYGRGFGDFLHDLGVRYVKKGLTTGTFGKTLNNGGLMDFTPRTILVFEETTIHLYILYIAYKSRHQRQYQ